MPPRKKEKSTSIFTLLAQAYGKVRVFRETRPEGTFLIIEAKLEDDPAAETGVQVVSKKTPPNWMGQ